MAHYAFGYSEPSAWPPYYVQDPWRTTPVPHHHFPHREHHYPLEQTRHALTRTLSGIGHAMIHPFDEPGVAPMHYPRADIHESEANYYVDIELPGVGGADKVKLKWLSGRTLLVEAHVKRPLTGEEPAVDTSKTGENGAGQEAKAAADGGQISNAGSQPADKQPAATEVADAQQTRPQQGVYMTLKERHVGSFGRAFNFPTSVDHAALEAHLEHGLVRLKVPKIPDAPVKDEHKMPEVKEGPRPEEKAKI